MSRLSREDWLEEGFRILTEFAQDKLRIQYLCDRLKVTRGSFYHHFSGMEHFIECLMDRWEEQNTVALIKGANEADSAEEQMNRLAQLVANRNQAIEAAIRSWSFYHPIVKKHLEKVDRVRLDYLVQLFEAVGFSSDKARLRAQLDYATLIGIQQLYPTISQAQMKALWEVQKEIIHWTT